MARVAAARSIPTKTASRLNPIAHRHRQFSASGYEDNLAEFIALFNENLFLITGATVNVKNDAVTLRAGVTGQICTIVDDGAGVEINLPLGGETKGTTTSLEVVL
ncbi:hypothetical protein LCGC14_1808750 [marine sediment metagenome]|uniref:Uncharacterized protein n=1 Tax=marine sediment metagenome TaxID=412755 RepID=A0A0F9JM22_9ZZZZ